MNKLDMSLIHSVTDREMDFSDQENRINIYYLE